MITLSKSKYMDGLKCPKLLWCHYNAKELIPPVDAATQAIFDQGHEVGDLAKKRFPGGQEVEWEKGFEHTLTRTKELLKARTPLYEASFKHKHAYCRADILLPAGEGSWDIIEVKSSTHLKDEYVDDVAFQKYCLEGNGLTIRRCHLMHVNNEYVRDGEIDLARFFTMEDITEAVGQIAPQVEDRITDMVALIQQKSMPHPKLAAECLDPKNCPVCLQDLPENSVAELYCGGKKAWGLLNDGIDLIRDIPGDVKLTDKQRIQRECVISGTRHVDAPAIKRWLATLHYPLYMLDFETVQPALPLFNGTRPYQKIPFQLSLHIIDAQGAKARHAAFLAEDEHDPRTAVVNALKAIGASGTVLAYNMSFEKGVIAGLLELCPAETWLQGIIDRMEDLIVPFRNFWIYDAEQHGSCSIKKVLPALTSTSYEHMEVSHGDEAARKFLAMTYKEKRQDPDLRTALLTYCQQDTQAMVDIVKVLEKAG